MNSKKRGNCVHFVQDSVLRCLECGFQGSSDVSVQTKFKMAAANRKKGQDINVGLFIQDDSNRNSD
jgi:hypothetical protein